MAAIFSNVTILVRGMIMRLLATFIVMNWRSTTTLSSCRFFRFFSSIFMYEMLTRFTTSTSTSTRNTDRSLFTVYIERMDKKTIVILDQTYLKQGKVIQDQWRGKWQIVSFCCTIMDIELNLLHSFIQMPHVDLDSSTVCLMSKLFLEMCDKIR